MTYNTGAGIFDPKVGSLDYVSHTHEAVEHASKTEHIVHFDYADGTRRSFSYDSGWTLTQPANGRGVVKAPTDATSTLA